MTFDIPQVREGGFYPEALERGLRIERALMTTLAEMYVQGVSTRKVAHHRAVVRHGHLLGAGEPGGGVRMRS